MSLNSNQTVSLPDAEYIVLSNIYNSAGDQLPLRQRELAQIAGASLGMTNSILKRLTQKGWITIKRINSRNIQYAVTLEGINEIVHRSYRYFKRTIRNVVFFKDILEDGQIYARVLAFNDKGAALLKNIKMGESHIPVITNMNKQAGADDRITKILKYDILASDIFNLITGSHIYKRSDFVMPTYKSEQKS